MRGLWRAGVAARRRAAGVDPIRLLAVGVALAAGVAVFLTAHELFPYHSANHDEGVYLQQAGLLLEGQLRLHPGSEALEEAVHPWFFVDGPAGLYPKYAPVPAAVFALGRLAGGVRLALFAVAAGNVWLIHAVVAAAFDRRTGVLAAATAAAAPLFVLPSSVFLSYAPTTAFNLLFALSYVRAVRGPDYRYAALAGTAIGLAFFARPYTAVLFATPFVGHALWHLARALPGDLRVPGRYAVVAAVGFGFVGLTLAYNAVLTGSPLRFPYQAFAPLDGIGFGRRRILGHDAVYTPELAVEANARVLWRLGTRWFTAGPLGTVAAAAGVGALALDLGRSGLDDAPLGDRRLRLLLAGLVPAVVAGNVYFWGNFNILGDLANPADGLVSLFGPFYHFDLLLPLSAFAAHGTLRVGAGVRALLARISGAERTDLAVRAGLAGVLVVGLGAAGAAEAAVLSDPVAKHAAYTDKYERAYAPLDRTDTSGGLVFLPPEYGEWRNHPFQYLRNDPGFDGPTVYAISRTPAADFAVLAAYPDRRYFRYRYHGAWTPDPNDPVTPILERLERHQRKRLSVSTRVAVPDRIERVSVAVDREGTIRRYDYEPAGSRPDTVTVNWTITPGGVELAGRNLRARAGDAEPVGLTGPERIDIAITLTEPGGGTLTYRESLAVRPAADGEGVVAVWPPSTSVCLLVTACGLEGTYVPDAPETRPAGIRIDTALKRKHINLG